MIEYRLSSYSERGGLGGKDCRITVETGYMEKGIWHMDMGIRERKEIHEEKHTFPPILTCSEALAHCCGIRVWVLWV